MFRCPDDWVLQGSVQCVHFTRKQRWCEWEAAYEESLRRAASSMNEAELAAVSLTCNATQAVLIGCLCYGSASMDISMQRKPKPESANSCLYLHLLMMAWNISGLTYFRINYHSSVSLSLHFFCRQQGCHAPLMKIYTPLPKSVCDESRNREELWLPSLSLFRQDSISYSVVIIKCFSKITS